MNIGHPAPSIFDLRRAYQAGASSPRDEIARVFQRMDAVEPLINSVLARHPDPEALDGRESHSGAPLYGVPVLVKDSIDTVAPLPTTAGSMALSGSSPSKNAPVVQRLVQAGARIVGKANLSEWGNFRALRSTRGWSAVGGLTVNPHALDRSAGGSSSGSAAAVAAGIVPVALGTETDGSIIAPAELCGVVGLKPTVGLLPADGIVPISSNQDTAGPITRTVRDAAEVMDVLAPRPAGAAPYVQACSGTGLDGMRIGVLDPEQTDLPASVAAVLDNAYEALSIAGADLAADVRLPSMSALATSPDEFEVLLYDFKWDLERYLDARQHPGIRTLADIIRFNSQNADIELAHFGQDVLERAAAKGPRTEAAYRSALARIRSWGRADGIDRALAAHGIDLIACPGFGPAWKVDLVLGDGPDLRRMASPLQASAVAGYPVITVPVGTVRGLPVGLSLLGGALSEFELLRAAHAVEVVLGGAPLPAFRTPEAG